MKLMIRYAAILCCTLAADAAVAQVVVPPLPVKEFATVGQGRNPLLGHRAGPRSSVHFIAANPSSGSDEPQFWDTLSRTTAASWYPAAAWDLWIDDIDYEPVNCAWGGSRVFCSLWAMDGPRKRESDRVVMFDLAAGLYAQAEFPFLINDRDVSADVVTPPRVGGVSNGRAVVAFPTYIDNYFEQLSEVVLVEDYATGSQALGTTTVAEVTPVGTLQDVSHPLVNDYGQVVYQAREGTGDYTLNMYWAGSGTVLSTQGYPNPVNPSDVAGTGTAIETQGSVSIMGFDVVGGTNPWYPGSAPVPGTFGCQMLRGLKLDPAAGVADFWLVHGVNCNGEASVLYALYHSLAPGATWEAYRVGSLSAVPEYDVRGDEIVFVDANGDVQWVRHAVNDWGLEEVPEFEPNDGMLDASPLPLNENLSSASRGIATLTNANDVDYWRLDAKSGLQFQVYAGNPDACANSTGPAYSVEAFDSTGAPFAPFGRNGSSQCPTLLFLAPTSGTYYVRIAQDMATQSDYTITVMAD